jgi:pyrroline-5-carboxylate reductase
LFTETHIAFIGGGNMAGSLIGGLLRKGFDAAHIHVADPDVSRLEHLRKRFSVQIYSENLDAARDVQVVIFAVKPQAFRDAARPLGEALARSRPLVISIAAGVPAKAIRRWLGYDAAVVRVMPNTPALIGIGAAALYANPAVSEARRVLAREIFETVGLALWIDDENQMNAVTAVSGSGPAYYFFIMEVMETVAVELGLPADIARQLVQQTAYGAVSMALESQDDIASLRKLVTSPGGTTAAAVKVLETGGLREIFQQALTAARQRGEELSDEFGKEKS